MTDRPTPPDTAAGERFALTTSRGFADWLAGTGGALAFTTYQGGKLFFLGLRLNRQVRSFTGAGPFLEISVEGAPDRELLRVFARWDVEVGGTR